MIGVIKGVESKTMAGIDRVRKLLNNFPRHNVNTCFQFHAWFLAALFYRLARCQQPVIFKKRVGEISV